MASTTHPDVPISSFGSSAYNDDSTAYCVAVKDALVSDDMKAISAVPCTPCAKLSRLMMVARPTTLGVPCAAMTE